MVTIFLIILSATIMTILGPLAVYSLARSMSKARRRPLVNAHPNLPLTWARKKLYVINSVQTGIFAGLVVLTGLKIHHGGALPHSLFGEMTVLEALSVPIQVVALLLLADLFNYVFHWASHKSDWLYHRIHYLHHEYVKTDEVYSFFYVHPIDMFLSNVAFLAPLLLLPWSLPAIYLFGAASMFISQLGHTDWALPRWLDTVIDPDCHRAHHVHERCNYAEHFTWIDRLLGTYRRLGT